MQRDVEDRLVRLERVLGELRLQQLEVVIFFAGSTTATAFYSIEAALAQIFVLGAVMVGRKIREYRSK